ncbi:MAG: hypothetical protein QOJ12_1520, partial [Thermoleophilales bacterium]|nr:hypothetical protein [Thermoleophilales bacterium]
MTTIAKDAASATGRGKRRRERDAVRQTVRVTVIAQDPSVRDDAGRILTTEVDVPAEHLEPGPLGARFYVVDYDPDVGTLAPPAEFDLEKGNPFPRPVANKTLTGDPRFRALNVYAIAARTLATFEAALGRRLEWASRDHQINLVPRAFAELNAYYSPEDGAIYFGHEEGRDGEVQTALSHDIVAHETTHAVLDGLRPRYNEPGLPDQPGFHEALGDIVALLSVFSLADVVQHLLGKADEQGRLRNEDVTPESLRAGALFGLAEELGADKESRGRLRRSGRGSSLRRSADIKPSPKLLGLPEFQEAHRRGEIVVAAVMQTLLSIWTVRLADLLGDEGPNRARVAEEGARAAGQLLRMVIRGIDYMPPVELEFSDVVEGIVKADEVVAPDDQRGYRSMLVEVFSAFGIERPKYGIVDVSGQ